MILKQPESNQTLRVRITDRNAESLYLCGFLAFVLSNGSGLALFVGGVMESFLWFKIKILLTQENMDSILIPKITRRAYK